MLMVRCFIFFNFFTLSSRRAAIYTWASKSIFRFFCPQSDHASPESIQTKGRCPLCDTPAIRRQQTKTTTPANYEGQTDEVRKCAAYKHRQSLKHCIDRWHTVLTAADAIRPEEHRSVSISRSSSITQHALFKRPLAEDPPVNATLPACQP